MIPLEAAGVLVIAIIVLVADGVASLLRKRK